MLCTHLHLTHLLQISVNPLSIQAVYTGTTMTEIKHYSCKNWELISPKEKYLRGHLEDPLDLAALEFSI